MTDSDSEPQTDSKLAPRPLDCLRNIGKYELEILSGDEHTEGGFCRVYRCQYKTQSSNKQAAIKVSLHAVEDLEHDIKAKAFTVSAAADSQVSNIVALACSGLHTRGNGKCTRGWRLAGHRLVKAQAFQLYTNVSENC